MRTTKLSACPPSCQRGIRQRAGLRTPTFALDPRQRSLRRPASARRVYSRRPAGRAVRQARTGRIGERASHHPAQATGTLGGARRSCRSAGRQRVAEGSALNITRLRRQGCLVGLPGCAVGQAPTARRGERASHHPAQATGALGGARRSCRPAHPIGRSSAGSPVSPQIPLEPTRGSRVE